MTPVLLGRWQTRTFVLWTIGLLVTFLVSLAYDGPNDIFFEVLFYVWLFGLGWDVVYHFLQQLKWDRDWPPFAQWAATAWEGMFISLVIGYVGLPGIEKGLFGETGTLDRFIAHYTLVWLFTFFWLQGPMRALFPFWRFHGGRIV
ncbi:MAG: hypothetical protein GEU28_02195 [Dehalococcoidia bacterium]|nr:hypothetical protein [Dehalococcoidia bacterium]